MRTQFSRCKRFLLTSELFTLTICRPQEENEEGTLVVKTDAPGLSLVPDHKHRVSVYNNYDDFLGGSKAIASGDLSLTSKIFADWGMVNMD